MPPITQSLLIANVAVFLLQASSNVPLENWFALWPLGSGLFAPWQMVSYGFLHGGFAHIFFNMLGLYMFGSDIERLFGSRYFITYYFACLVSAAVCQLVFTALAGGPAIPTVGASGALYGLLLAFGMYFPRRMVMLIFPPIPMPARIFVILFGGLELLFGVTGTADGVAHFAHLGGMLGGWLVIQFRRRGFPFTRR
jgi:membrane associated rhomboid family serine protease